MRKSYIIVPLLFVLAGISIVLYSNLRSRDAFSENLIVSLSKNLEKELEAYFSPVREEFSKIADKYNNSSGAQMDEDSLSAQLIPAISGIPAIGAVMLYNNRGYIYNIYREKNTFLSCLDKPDTEGNALVWSRRMSDNSVSSNWTEVLIGQEDRLQVGKGILEMIAADDESVVWTDIYQSRNLKEPVISAAVDWISGLDSSVFICSFEMPIRLIIRHLNSFNKYEHRRIFMSMTSGQLVDIPARVPDSLLSFSEEYRDGLIYTIEDSILFSFINSWKQLGAEIDMTYHQEIEADDWWIHIRDFSTFEKIAGIGLAMPEGSLKMGLIRSYSSVIVVVVLLLLSILIFTAATARRKTSKRDASGLKSSASAASVASAAPAQPAQPDRPGSPADKAPLTPLSGETDWMGIIGKGENQSVEFKSALRMDMNLGKVNTRLENVIIKSIAAFSNAEGGTLFIGVRDDGSILGIEGDMSTLKKQDSDFFEIHLRNLLKQQFGVTFMTRNIIIEFPKLDGKEICSIRISKGSEPAYVTVMDKNGNKVERFYVRSGNSSQEIQSLKEINDYISKRF